MIAGRMNLMSHVPEPLPYDSEIEYIQSTGPQYIDTGMAFGASSVIRCTFQVPDENTLSSGNAIVLSARRANSSGYVRLQVRYPNRFYLDGDAGRSNFSFSPSMTTSSVVTVMVSQTVSTVSGDSIGSIAYGGASSVDAILLFRDAVNGNAGAVVRVMGYTLYNSDVKALDLVPVRVGLEGCMYDNVTKQLFRNQGTGSFLKGPDVPPSYRRGG